MKNRKRISSIFQIGVVGALLSTALTANAQYDSQIDGYTMLIGNQFTKVTDLPQVQPPFAVPIFTQARVDFSSDGQWKVYFDDQGRVISEQIKEGGEIELASEADDVRGFVISPDSTSVYYTDWSGALYRIAITGEASSKAMLTPASVSAENEFSSRLQMTDDGQYLLYTKPVKLETLVLEDGEPLLKTYQSGELFIYSVATGVEQKISDELSSLISGEYNYGIRHFSISEDGKNVVFFQPHLVGDHNTTVYPARYMNEDLERFEFADTSDLYNLSVTERKWERYVYWESVVDIATGNPIELYRNLSIHEPYPNIEDFLIETKVGIRSVDMLSNGRALFQARDGHESQGGEYTDAAHITSPTSKDNAFIVGMEKAHHDFLDIGMHTVADILDILQAPSDSNAGPLDSNLYNYLHHTAEVTPSKQSVVAKYALSEFMSLDPDLEEHKRQKEQYKLELGRIAQVVSVDGNTQPRYLFPIDDAKFDCQPKQFIRFDDPRNSYTVNGVDVRDEIVPIEGGYTLEAQCNTWFGEFEISEDETSLFFAAKTGNGTSPDYYDPVRVYRSDFSAQATGNATELTQLNATELSGIELVHHEATNKLMFIDNALYNELFVVIDLATGERKDVMPAYDFAVIGDNYVVIETAYQGLAVYDLKTGEIIAEITAENTNGSSDFIPPKALKVDDIVFVENNVIYLQTDLGLYRIDTAEAAPVKLVSNRWNIVSVGDLQDSGMTLSEVLSASDLAVADYGRNWVMYGVNPSNGAYLPLTANSMLKPGTGYWMFQSSGSEKGYSAHGTGASIVTDNANCASSAGCYSLSLSTDRQMQLIGQPLMKSVKWSDVRVEVDGVGCTVAQANTANVFADIFWHYNGTAYEVYSSQLPPSGDATLEAYRGYWVALRTQGFGRSINLLFPAGEVDQAQTLDCAVAN